MYQERGEVLDDDLVLELLSPLLVGSQDMDQEDTTNAFRNPMFIQIMAQLSPRPLASYAWDVE